MNAKKDAFRFVIFLGIVSLFADMVYEGARSIIGPYLGILGASGAVVGFIAGFGELIGYILRIVSGYFVDKTSKYWTITFLGYSFNLIAIPLLAFATSWKIAALLIILERVGKAIRTPSRDAMLSFASQRIGRGRGFGIHQLLDQIGALSGPLIIALALFSENNYRFGFILLAIPAFLSILILFFVKTSFPNPHHLEVAPSQIEPSGNIPKIFWIYLVGTMFIAAGYADFPLIAFHFQKSEILDPLWIPIFYAISMSASAIAALLFGLIYDRDGCKILIVAILLSSASPALLFLGDFKIALWGMILWGIGMGAQRSLLKAIIGDMISKKNRGAVYGIFNTGYGIAWFLGSWLIGILYDISIFWLILFSVFIQLCAIPFIFFTSIVFVKRF